MMMLRSLLAILAVSLVCLLSRVESFPSGSGACPADVAATNGSPSHVIGTNELKALSARNTVLTIDGVAMAGGVTTTFAPGKDLTWTVATTGTLSIRGILVRVDSSNGFTLTGNTGLQVAAVCTGSARGITQTDASDKRSVSGTMRFDAAGSAKIDVTVVYVNGAVAKDSITGYTAYKVNFAAAPPPTAPVAKPTAPVAKPTAPVAKPTAPVAKPTAPVAKPTAPVAKPTAPVAKPPAPVPKPPAPAPKKPKAPKTPKSGDMKMIRFVRH